MSFRERYSDNVDNIFNQQQPSAVLSAFLSDGEIDSFFLKDSDSDGDFHSLVNMVVALILSLDKQLSAQEGEDLSGEFIRAVLGALLSDENDVKEVQDVSQDLME